MSSSRFSFQQFHIDQHQCAMKVTRDACLLGAWADVSHCRKLLDIGAGTGLLSLMCAQRSQATIDAIELDENAASQAIDNCAASPWSDRVKVHQQSLQQWLHTSEQGNFDGIISNPPFFNDSLRCPDPARNQARHTDTLDYATLIGAIDHLLSAKGQAWLLLPTHCIALFTARLPDTLFLDKLCHIAHSAQHHSKRSLLRLSRHPQACDEQQLYLFDDQDQYSDAARQLLSPYYLRFSS